MKNSIICEARNPSVSTTTSNKSKHLLSSLILHYNFFVFFGADVIKRTMTAGAVLVFDHLIIFHIFFRFFLVVKAEIALR